MHDTHSVTYVDIYIAIENQCMFVFVAPDA